MFALYQIYGYWTFAYLVYPVLVGFPILYVWKGNYHYKIMERILYISIEMIGIIIFSVYMFSPNSISNYDWDFIAVLFMLPINVFFNLFRLSISQSRAYGWSSTERKVIKSLMSLLKFNLFRNKKWKTQMQFNLKICRFLKIL